MILEDMALAYEVRYLPGSGDRISRLTIQQLAAHPKMLEAARDRLILPTPIFDIQKTKIATDIAESSGSGTSGEWEKLEEEALSTWDRKGKKPLRLLPDPSRRTASVQGEPRDMAQSIVALADRLGTFHVELTATNPLNSRLTLSDIRVSLSGTDEISSDSLDEIELEPYESRVLAIPISLPKPGKYTVNSVRFNFNRFFPYEQTLARKGRRLHATKQHRIQPTYADDTTLTISIEPSRPTATVSIDTPPGPVHEGEEVPMTIHIRNTGTVPFDQVQLFTERASPLRVNAGMLHLLPFCLSCADTYPRDRHPR